MNSYFEPTIPGKKPRTEKVRDLDAEDRKLMLLYQIYGNQNPTTRTRRGRKEASE